MTIFWNVFESVTILLGIGIIGFIIHRNENSRKKIQARIRYQFIISEFGIRSSGNYSKPFQLHF